MAGRCRPYRSGNRNQYRQETACFSGSTTTVHGRKLDTIAGYKEHGAIVHYEATPETDVTLKAEGFLLLDSGAQYLDGTTDITRTIALGELTEEEKTDYTLILKGHIALLWPNSLPEPVEPSSMY